MEESKKKVKKKYEILSKTHEVVAKRLPPNVLDFVLKKFPNWEN